MDGLGLGQTAEPNAVQRVARICQLAGKLVSRRRRHIDEFGTDSLCSLRRCAEIGRPAERRTFAGFVKVRAVWVIDPSGCGVWLSGHLPIGHDDSEAQIFFVHPCGSVAQIPSGIHLVNPA